MKRESRGERQSQTANPTVPGTPIPPIPQLEQRPEGPSASGTDSIIGTAIGTTGGAEDRGGGGAVWA